jgi:dipeptidyl aminopeptidase/acylaminoacyl peptidase
MVLFEHLEGAMAESNRRPITPNDLLTFKAISDAQISPDGQVVAFVAGAPVKIDTPSPKSRIWLAPTDGGSAREFTTGPQSDYSPRWSPDGQTLAFLSDRSDKGTAQIYLISRQGGEATGLTELEGDVGVGRSSEALHWSPDGQSIAFLLRDPESETEAERKREKNDALEFEENQRFVRLWVIDVASRAAHPVTPEGLHVWEFSWSPNGERFALVVADSPEEWSWYRARVAIVPAAGGEVVDVYAPERQIARPVFSPDGRSLALVESVFSDRGVIAGDVLIVPVERGAARNLTDGSSASFSWVEWIDHGRALLALAHEDGGQSLWRLDVTRGERGLLWSDQCGVAEPFWPRFSCATDGTLAVARESLTSPREVWIARPTGETYEWRALTSLNASASQLTYGDVEVVRWRAADGMVMHGWLIRPPGTPSDRPAPLVTWVHGGPTSVYNARYYGNGTVGYLAARGFVVFLPNPRGSVGWGRAFAEANVGDLGGKDFGDIQAGIDHLVKTGIVDEGRLGIGGWSYGGFMTAWAITQSTRFRAAVVGAGIASWRSFHGVSHLTAWDAIHLAADPYQIGGPFDRFSPMTYIKQVQTPTLIVHGQNDRDVPVEQAYELYRALKDLGVETKLVVFPREGHGFNEQNHVLDLNRRIVEWFETRVLGTGG